MKQFSKDIDIEDVVFSLIPNNDYQRIKGWELTVQTGVTNIRKVINNMRQQGVPICSDSNGYYISDNPDEIAKTINQLRSRADMITHAIFGLMRA